MKIKTIIISVILCLKVSILTSQTVPVTFYLDATNTQYETVQIWHYPDKVDYTDDNGDQEFELTLDIETGTTYYYHVLTDNGWGWDPLNPNYSNGQPTDGSYMNITDPMISYLLPKDGDMLRENTIRADFAYSPENPPIESTIQVVVNGNEINNILDYYNVDKKRLQINNPEYLVSGHNEITVSYQTNKGSVSRTSAFIYQPIKLMMDSIIYRMDTTLVWGRVFNTPYPSSVFVECHGNTYEASVNNNGYFGTPVVISTGKNTIKAAYSLEGLNSPVDTMVINAEIRHNWWVELTGEITDNTATITSIAHDIDISDLNFSWGEDSNPENIGISGNTSATSFTVPSTDGEYIISLDATSNNGENYTAKKMLIVDKGSAHFLGIHERAPWMEKMMLYEVQLDYLDNFTFQGLKTILPHIKKAGINAFRITPFVLGGYISYDHFQIYTPYGSITDLQDLINTAHRYGIKVMFDVPLNHICPYHPFLYPSFLLKENAAPYLNFVSWEGTPGESDIQYNPDNGRQCVYTNLDNPYVQSYFFRLMEYWVEVVGADGFRIDCGAETILRAPDFMSQMLKHLRNINPNLFILQEGDNRDYPDVNYYDFGDAAYDWKLNSEWGDGGQGFPGVYKGMYTIDELHNLITNGTPDSGLVMRYANSGYHDYFHNRYGWEQEHTAFAIVSTTYGLPNIFQGEMVGAERANGTFDFSDPLNNMPFYSRLIKMRKALLGNYPSINRIDISSSDMVYCYTASHDTTLILTVANFADEPATVSINLSDAAFNGKQIKKWYEVTDSVQSYLEGQSSVDVTLNNFETKVFVINATEEVLFPTGDSLHIINVSGESEITHDKSSLNFIAEIYPEISFDEIEWLLHGDTQMATISNGELNSCGCGNGEVIVIARLVNNPEIADSITINILNQTSGGISNSTFDYNISDWMIWSPNCNNNLIWENGEAKIIIGDNGSDCWSQVMNTNNMLVEQEKIYEVRFDAYASVNKTIDCKVRENGNSYADLSDEHTFDFTTAKQTFSFKFKATEPTSSIGQIHFNFNGSNEFIWIDNVSFCETEADPPVLTISEIQGNTDISPYANQLVETNGEVTLTDQYGCFIQDANETYSGIYIYNSDFSTLSIGDGLNVKGIVKEYNGSTEISDIEWSETFSSTYDITPINLNQVALSEEYESILLKIEDVEAVEENQYSDWQVKFSNDQQIYIDDKFYSHELTQGNLYNIIGIVNYRYETFSLNPRFESDIEDLGAAPVKVNITFQVDMQNEAVPNSVVLMGNWNNWTDSTELTANESIYSGTLLLNAGDQIEFKYVNLSSFGDYNYETINGDCISNEWNRYLTVPDKDSTLSLVCFGSCSECSSETGINSFNKDKIKVYPNPAENIVYVDFNEKVEAKISLIDIMGRRVYEKVADETKESIHLESYNPGIYLLIIDNGIITNNFKLIIK